MWNFIEQPTKDPADLNDERIGTPCVCGGSFSVIISKLKKNGTDWHQLICDCCEAKGLSIPSKVNPESVKDFVMPFGKHCGASLEQIWIKAPDYLKWCAENLEATTLRRRIEIFLKAKND